MRLPSYQDLTKEQEAINNLPLSGSYLVTGPPGTGKTVVALYRTQMVERRKRTAQLIMFNGLLKRYTAAALQSLNIAGSAETYLSWLHQSFRSRLAVEVPRVGDYRPDWPEVAKILKDAGPRGRFTTDLLVDEGQDLPPGFYQVVGIMADNVTVFADENQTITDQNSTFEQIREGLGKDHKVLRLTKNHRNTLQIAQVAEVFLAETRTGVADLPDRDKGEKPQIRFFPTLESSAEFVRTFEANNSTQEIGVFVAKRTQVGQLSKLLEEGTKNPVHSYLGNKASDGMSLGEPGIRIMCSESAKGLEFDAVFILGAQEFPQQYRDETALKRRFYVMTSRARDVLFMCWSGTQEPAILANIPAELVDRRSVK